MADLGLCLHQSSSGLDLPMKLADLRGAGVPVATYDYSQVLGEVMETGHEGVTFRDPGDLANLLVAVATRSIAPDGPLAKSRAWLQQHPPQRWDAQWESTARPGASPVTPSTDRSRWRATPESPPPRRRRSAAPWPSSSNVSGSRGPTSNNWFCSNRVVASAPPTPTTSPAITGFSPCTLIILITSRVRGAERHAHADFARALRHQPRDHAVDAQRREHQAGGRQQRHQHRVEARLRHDAVETFIHRADREHGQAAVERSHRLVESPSSSMRRRRRA